MTTFLAWARAGRLSMASGSAPANVRRSMTMKPPRQSDGRSIPRGARGRQRRVRVATMRRFASSDVQSVFKAYPPALRAKLMALREILFDTAAMTEGVGPLTETLKWGQPSYLTEETGSGTTVRIDRLKAADGYAV